MNQVNAYFVPITFISLTSFIIGSLFYDHYQRGYLFTSRLSNETIFIEQALKRIQRCNEEDYLRQRALLYTFQTWNHLAHSHHIRYWIAYKTLASYIQHNDLSPYDDDIDIFIIYQDIPRLINLINANYSSIYELKIHPQWFITKVFNRSYTPSEIINFTIQNTRFINHKNNVSINIWPIYKYYNKHILLFVEYHNFDNLILTPIEWIFPLEPCVFSGIRVWCPAQPKKLTASIYRQTSVYMSCINGSWIKSN
ncbi:unnamed protein product [Rotaria sordida]|uniref:LicD/FKTN/FKRP nucleotidyltransferase domain-containing protein n=1 Tax=Rotaria sordida TaxID=392033 RepID=A0A814SR88_9BILA|nr:unnamed protein product [Rotaria sordida]